MTQHTVRHLDTMPAFFTIGHSTRSIDAFVAMLRSTGVELVADVRAIFVLPATEACVPAVITPAV